MEAKLFTESPEGIKIHWQVDADNVVALTKNTDDLLNWLIGNEFHGDPGFGKTTVAPDAIPFRPKQDDGVPFDTAGGQYNGPAPSQRPQQASSLGPAPQCGFCSGDVWDNRGNERSEKAPQFKCKDKDCGGAAWIKKDGGLNWKLPAL